MRLRNRKIVAVCPKKVSQRRSYGHLGEAEAEAEAEAVNQTFLKCRTEVSEIIFKAYRILYPEARNTRLTQYEINAMAVVQHKRHAQMIFELETARTNTSRTRYRTENLPSKKEAS